ncbi:MAG: response regulator [Elusimicrobiota bacterium]
MPVKRILVVEDEVEVVKAIQFILEEANYEVLAANNGLEGLEKARKEKPDLIILDLMLPEMDGFEVCRLLKSDDNYRDIPIIMLTALAQQEGRDWGEKAGADYYLAKPFDNQVLLDKIKEL